MRDFLSALQSNGRLRGKIGAQDMEIGSEFWKRHEKYVLENEELFLSGRTALNAILKDILSEGSVSSALLPSYCCHTMIEPFQKNKIPVRFYDVFIDEKGKLNADIPEPRKNEIFYVMQYFGNHDLCYTGSITKELEEQNWSGLWKISIEDTTHSCYYGGHEFKADYEFKSCRKWMALDGIAIARKKKGTFSVKPERWKVNRDFCHLRNKAFAIKNGFISEKSNCKSDFLDMFRESELLLSSDYEGYRPDVNTVIQYFTMEMSDREQLREKRIENSKILIDGLKEIKEIMILLNYSDTLICPLFVPVIVPKDHRDSLRQYLIDHDIYCPVHWPLTEAHNNISERAREIYDRELSLICDQRYGKEDMEREVQVIWDYFKRQSI